MTEDDFAAALLNPDLPAPPRFAIHRNIVTSGLTQALELGFPVTRQVVGQPFFAAMARAFIHHYPPSDPRIALYGADLAHFLTGFEPAQSLPYLPDLASLEQAIRESYHSDNAPAAALPTNPDAWLTARLTLAPSLRLIRSAWPIHAIWAHHTQSGPTPRMQPENVVVLRRDFDPEPHLLPAADADFVSSILAGHPVAQALQAAGTDFDPTETLTLLLKARAITRFLAP